MEKTIALLYLLLPFISSHMLWPNKRTSIINGTIYLVGFFPIHETDYTHVCGRITEEGLQQLETFLLSVKGINDDHSILPHIRLGAIGYDSCDSPSYVLELATDLIHGFMVSNQDLKSQLKCKNNQSLEYVENRKVVAVIGGKSSGVSLQLANFLRVFQIPQVSYKSTLTVLSNLNLYEYFFRTVAPITHQIKAILKIIEEFKWTYISVVYSDTAYGNSAYGILLKLAPRDLCFASEIRMSFENFNDTDYDGVLNELLKQRATAVLICGEQGVAKNVMAAAKRKQAKDCFVWLGLEAWANRDYAVKGYEEYAEGTLCIGYIPNTPPGFYEHFKSLTPENAVDDPWFYEFWEMQNQCRYPNSAETPYNKNFTRNCTGSEPIKEYMQNMPSAHLVKDAVYAVATALHNIHNAKCGGQPGWCKEMENLDGKLIREYLLNVTFNDEKGNFSVFNAYGDASPRYSIVNYQKNATDNRYYWEIVGTYTMNGSLPYFHLDKRKMRYKNEKEFPESICSKPCLSGETKVPMDRSKCCWSCYNCTDYQYAKKEGGCEECNKGYIPNENKTLCIEIPETHMNFKNPWSLFCIIFAVFGILVTLTVTVIFRKNWDTPIIKASGRELSALLLFGIFMSFLLTFPIVKKPTAKTCGIVRFFLGFNYTVCYAPIFTKTRIIAAIFECKGRHRKSKFRSPKSQLMMAAALISIAGIINATWLMYDIPSTDHLYPSREENILICEGSNSAAYFVGLLYPFMLMILCTVYAFKTRKCPGGFNEARYITFANYTTCVIWLAFIPMFVFHRSIDVKTSMLSLLLSSSAIVQIICLFLPKVYVALLRPENNTKEIVMGYTAGTSTSETTSI